MRNLSPIESNLLDYLTRCLRTDIRDEFSFKVMSQSLGIVKDDLEIALQHLESNGVIKKAAFSGYDYCIIELLV